MPKTAACALTWSPEQALYKLRRQGTDAPLQRENQDQFIQMINASSFSFQGQFGHLTLRKEARLHGEGYWYAYRNQGRRTLKRYAGRAADLTIAHLEEIAAALNAEAQTAQGQANVAGSFPVPEMILPAQSIDAEPRKRTPDGAYADTIRQYTPLLASKLSLPRLSSTLVARERLFARLDTGLESKLTLLSAPAGFGKTTLARQWIAHQNSCEDGPSVAWVSLDSRDNDPVRFWSYVIAACQTFPGKPGQSALALLHTTEQPSLEQATFETPLTFLLNDLNQLPRKSLLVLEDYHVITAPQIHQALAFFLDHLPTTFHLVILTRSDPALPLTRLRAAGELNEFKAEDLRFSPEETKDFLRQTLELLPAQELLARLDATFEGWVAGLRLLTLALRGCVSEHILEQQLTTFSGSRRHLLAYFASEVLANQPEATQLFLLQTSGLHNLTAPLCDAVTERKDSVQMLEDLERANLFLSPLDGDERWYRYHPLFAAALQREADRHLGAETLRACSERASAWYARHGLLSEAIEAALTAQAFEHAATLIEQFTGPQRFHEMREHHTLQRWLDALPLTALEQHPLLCLLRAMVLLFASDCQVSLSAELLAQVEQPLRMAERVWQAEENRGGLGEALAFRTVLARFQGRPDLATRQARQALAWLPANAHQWRATCLSTLGEEEFQAGELCAAWQTFLEARANFAAAGNQYGVRVVLLTLGDICVARGEHSQAGEFYREVLASAGNDLIDRAGALLGLARLSCTRHDLTMAEQEAREAYELGQRLAHEKIQAQASRILADIQRTREQRTIVGQSLAALAPVLLPLQPIEPLSPQEQRVLNLLTSGLTNSEIAQSLVVSSNTVKTQVQSIFRKLNVHSRKEIRDLLRAQYQS